MGIKSFMRRIGDSGLNLIGAPKDRKTEKNVEISAGLSLHDTSPRASIDGKGKSNRRNSVDTYPTGRNSLDLSQNEGVLGNLYRTDVKVQKDLEKKGLSAFI
mmetsp:Transcript_8589/g.13621  ORF Transcript_8589/g.13621 Transcript_8589/m.13621 type:complete len:102 (-) Transcript_8589:198-503(-)